MPKSGLPVSDTYFDNHRLSSLCDQNCQWWDSWETSRGLAILTFLPIQHCRESHFCYLYTHTHTHTHTPLCWKAANQTCQKSHVPPRVSVTDILRHREFRKVLCPYKCLMDKSVHQCISELYAMCLPLSEQIFFIIIIFYVFRVIWWGHCPKCCPSKNCRISVAQTVECGTSNPKGIHLISRKYINK